MTYLDLFEPHWTLKERAVNCKCFMPKTYRIKTHAGEGRHAVIYQVMIVLDFGLRRNDTEFYFASLARFCAPSFQNRR